MTIWNALSAGAALWCAVFGLFAMHLFTDMRLPADKMVRQFCAVCVAFLAFGLFLWGAIP